LRRLGRRLGRQGKESGARAARARSARTRSHRVNRSEDQLPPDVFQELARNPRYVSEVVDRVEALVALPVSEHRRRLGDGEADLAELLEGRTIQVDLITGLDLGWGRGLVLLRLLFGRLLVFGFDLPSVAAQDGSDGSPEQPAPLLGV